MFILFQFNPQAKGVEFSEAALQWILEMDAVQHTVDTEEGQSQLLQRYALASIYYSWHGDYWINNDGWLGAETECEWAGISCDERGKIIEISLPGNNLVGHLGPDFELFSSVRMLNVSGNSNLMAELSAPFMINWSKLEVLDASNCAFFSNIPSQLGESWPNIEYVDLTGNGLTGTIPSLIMTWRDHPLFEEALFLENQLTGTIPETLEASSNLVVVSLHQNGFFGETGGLCSADSTIQLLTTDCATITCPCCTECCDGKNCYGDVLWDTLENSQGDWEENFERSDYGFNPHILFTSEKPKRG